MFKVPCPGEPFLNASDDESINTEKDIYDEENLILQESVNSMEDNLEKDSLQLDSMQNSFERTGINIFLMILKMPIPK